MSEYGFMPAEPCDECKGRWPTRYQYEIEVHGPDAEVLVRLCSQCFSRLFHEGVRAFNLKYTGARKA